MKVAREWRLFVLEGRLCGGGDGTVSAQESGVKDKKGTFSCQVRYATSAFASKGAVVSKRALARARRAPSVAWGAPYMLRRAQPWAERTFFVPKWIRCRWERRRICLEWRIHVREWHHFVTKGALDGGMSAVSALKGAVTGKMVPFVREGRLNVREGVTSA